MPTLYYLQKCLHRDFLILQGFSTILFSNFFCLQTNCKHFAIFSTFLNFSKSHKPLFYGLFTTTVFIFFSTSTCSGYSHIISIIYTYSIIRISLFIRLGNIYIICIYDITCTISISLTWTSCGHCPHPFIWYDYINFCLFIQSAIYLFSICFVSLNSLSKSDT